MLYSTVNIEDISRNTSLIWDMLLYGLQKDWLSTEDIEDCATQYLIKHSNCSDEYIVSLSSVNIEKLSKIEVLKLLSRLAKYDDIKVVKETWLRTSLRNIYIQNCDPDIKLKKLAQIYSEFDYPKEIKNLVYYLPPNDEWVPEKHTMEDNTRRLFELWRQYLNKSHN